MRSMRMWICGLISCLGVAAWATTGDAERERPENRAAVRSLRDAGIATSPTAIAPPEAPAPTDAVRTSASFQREVLNDECSDQSGLVGQGTFAFDVVGATAAGELEPEQNHEACDYLGERRIEHDAWYCWEAESDCTVSIDTCAQTTVDTKIAVYQNCACPPTDATLLDCNDDAPDCGLGSRVTFDATTGQSYLIRLGTSPEQPDGTGTFTVACTLPLPCVQPDYNCQTPDNADATRSDRDNFVVAEGFSPGETNTINEICWWGAYSDGSGDCQGSGTDSFEVTYYANADGFPDDAAPLASFSQVGGTLAVTGPVATGDLILGFPEYEYSAAHAPVPVTAGQCYWVEITNSVSDPSCSWFWEVSSDGEGRICQDGAPLNGYGLEDVRLDLGDQAFCIDLPLADVSVCLPEQPGNDDCSGSTTVSDGIIYFDSSNATTDGWPTGPPGSDCDFEYGYDNVSQDIWFDYQATCTASLEVSLCGSWFDTRLAVYDGIDCPEPAEYPLTCNDDFCGPENEPPWPYQSQVSLPVVQGEMYKIRVGGVLDDIGTDGGWGVMKITCGDAPPNDNCEDVTTPDLFDDGVPLVFTGNNELASNDCPLFPGAHVWIAFNLVQDAWVTLEYCDTVPPFNNAWDTLALGCPCTDTTDQAICDFACDGAANTNPFLSWGCLPAGVYYYPVLSEAGSEGPYSIEVTADTCDRCAVSTGDCYTSNGTPGCDDPDCCSLVCDQDSYCCCVEWDQYCADAAEALCGGFEQFCSTATGDCCSPHEPGAGCETQECCVAVCEQDDWCCTHYWDQQCSDEAALYCGALCKGCPDGTVTFVDPMDGYFDSRQPHRVRNLALQGVDTFEVLAPPNITDMSCWSMCETNQNPGVHPSIVPPAGSNTILSVTDNGGGSYTIELQRPIAQGEVTDITYDNTLLSGSTVVTGRFAYHPGDVDRLGTSSAADIQAVIDSINGTLRLPNERADVDRNGVQGPADILRIIDLLNGAGLYEDWSGVTVDHQATCPTPP